MDVISPRDITKLPFFSGRGAFDSDILGRRTRKEREAEGDRSNMVCLACLLPLFLVPIVNVLPILVDYIMAKIYGAFGWEYRKPVRAPPSCPYKPTAAAKNDSNLGSQEDSATPHPVEKPSEVDNSVELTAKDKAA